MKSKYTLVLSLILLLANYLTNFEVKCIYRGVTVESKPFVIKDGNQFKGYLIDILNEMKNISDFDYYLYEEKSLGNISLENQKELKISGLLGDVWSNSADFGVSNIEVREDLKRFVDFSYPLFSYSVSALIQDSNLEEKQRVKSLRQLADQMTISYGSLRNSSVLKLFDSSDDLVLKRMHALMNSTGVSVDTLEEAVLKVKRGKYAFIADSYLIEELAKSDCDLTVIEDNRQYFQRHISLVVSKGSSHLSYFNDLIERLRQSGRFNQIKDRYWKAYCPKSSTTSVSPINFIAINVIIIIIPIIGSKYRKYY